MNQLPDGFVDRPGTLDDAEALALLLNTYGQRVIGADLISAERLAGQIQMPGFSVEEDIRLIFDVGGALVGAGVVMDMAEPHVNVTAWGIVGASHQGRGLGTFLYDWIYTRAQLAVAKAPVGTRVVLNQEVFETDSAAINFLEARGFSSTRHFWRMAIAFSGGLDTPIWPNGMVVRSVDVERELEQSVRAADEAFKDHYGHVDRPIEEQIERIRQRIERDPNYDPELNFAVWDGNEIAGFCYADPISGTDETTGYINALGVLRPWRKKGLGLAILLEAFDRLASRGKEGAHLHVDAASLTGATRLYQKAGMQVDQLNHEYTLELRPGVDLTTR